MNKLSWALVPFLLISCSKSSPREQIVVHKTASKVLSAPQKSDLEQRVLDSLSEAYSQLSPDAKWSAQAARVHLSKLTKGSVTLCDLSFASQSATQKCLILEVVLQVPALPKINLDQATLSKIDTMLMQIMMIQKELDLLVGQAARVNMPFVAKSFFENKRFVLTTSLQQGSVGNSRVYNLESLSVSLAVNSNRLVVLQNKAGLFPSSDSNDLVVTSYPIVSTRTDGSETYFQIDFSQPENAKMFRNALYEGGDPALDITADIVVPSVAHKDKAPNKSLNSSQYFNGNDQNLVLDSLVLLSGQFQPNGADMALMKDFLHPTMRVVQGLFVETENDKSFANQQGKEVSQLGEQHLSSNTIDLTDGQDVPFFTTSPFLSRSVSGNVGQKSMVKKFDASQDIVFVLSANTPAKVVAVLKSAVESYNNVFATFQKNQSTKIRAISSAEFVDFVKETNSDIPESPIAADPRVNMISWSNDDALGAAWATTVANPFSGRIISGDVMMSGSLWAKVGCSTYFSKIWASQVVKGENLASLVPSDALRQKWSADCIAAIKELDLDAKEGVGPTNSGAKALLSALTEDSLLLPARYQTSVLSSEAVSVEKVLKPSPIAQVSNVVTFRLGNNTLRLARPCDKNPSTELSVQTNFGAPGLDTKNVKSPAEGALAMVRSVTLHELGHLFGMRHNFAGSLTTAKLTSISPIPLMTQSDSFMDYNDYGVDMSAGALADYQDFMSGKNTPSFGAYDVLALAQIYDLDTSALTFDKKPSFCTDGNVRRAGATAYGDCKPDDYGTDSVSFALFQLNQSLLTLRAVGLPLDASGGFRLQNQLAGAIKSLTFELFLAQEKLVQKSVFGAEKDALLLKIRAITLAESSNQMLSTFSALSGVKLVGLNDALKLTAEVSFENENSFLRKFDALIVQKTANDSFVQAVSELSGYRRSQFGDAKYSPVFQDMAGYPEFQWKTQFINQKAGQVVLPKGTEVEFSYFDDGKIVEGSQAKLGDKPVLFVLDEPMLNHNKVIRVKRLKVSDATGAEKEVLATTAGKYTIQDLKSLAASVAILDPFGGAAENRLKDDKKYLGCVSGLMINDCPVLESLSLQDVSLVAAKSLYRTYERLEAFLRDPEAP